jgi:hypothetical protein
MVMSGSWCAGCNQWYKLEKVNPRSLFLSLADRHSWNRTSKVGIRAINEYLKKDPVATIYQEMSTTMQKIQHSFGSTIHNRITPTPSLTHSDSQSVHLEPPVSPCSLSGDHREARTKRRRICLGSGRDSRIGHRKGGCKRMLEVRGRTTGNIPSLQEAGGPIDSSSGMGVPSLEPHLTRRIGETDFPQTATQTMILERSDAVQNTLNRAPQIMYSDISHQPQLSSPSPESHDLQLPEIVGDGLRSRGIMSLNQNGLNTIPEGQPQNPEVLNCSYQSEPLNSICRFPSPNLHSKCRG